VLENPHSEGIQGQNWNCGTRFESCISLVTTCYTNSDGHSNPLNLPSRGGTGPPSIRMLREASVLPNSISLHSTAFLYPVYTMKLALRAHNVRS